MLRRPVGALEVLLVAGAFAATGCVQVLEANFQAVETLTSRSATDEETGVAIGVIGGTTAFLTAIGVVATVGAMQVGGDSPAPPAIVIENELGWGFVRERGEARWYRCTSRLLCTHELVTEPENAVIEVSPAGRGQPLATDGLVGGEVDLVALRVRRRR